MTSDPEAADRLQSMLEAATDRLEAARPFAKSRHQHMVLDLAQRLLAAPGGLERLEAMAPRLDAAGLFAGSDWDRPEALSAQLVPATFDAAPPATVTLEAVSLLRLLKVALGEASHPGLHADRARHHLAQVLALNLRRLFSPPDEAARERRMEPAVRALLKHLADRIGLQDVLGVLVAEIWRILAQRPIQVNAVKEMIAQISVTLASRPAQAGDARLGADRLISALFGPTEACRDDPGLAVYRARLEAMDEWALTQEARTLARAMHDTGLVSDYHAAFLDRALSGGLAGFAPEALGLTSVGLDCWRRHQALAEDLLAVAVTSGMPQAVLGLAELLERGILHHPAIPPALRRQLSLTLSPEAERRLAQAYGPAASPRSVLVAGVLQVLGQPLGVGQGANPTCQSARAIAMWALNDPDFLLHVVANAAHHDTVLMHFEGRPINSADLPAGLAAWAPLDADPVSLTVVPHLDRIYAEMGRLCGDRGDDPHIWINPEFHGWWVGRDCAIAVDVPTGRLADIEGFLRRFYAAYHPRFNGGQPVIHPQPAGIAVTDATGRFVGWHAIAILRMAADVEGAMRVYFYNPNNDSGQDWGGGIVVSTQGKGERHGEASLPIDQFAARLYLFHVDPLHPEPEAEPSDDEIAAIARRVRDSWARGRGELTALDLANAGA
ncbi:hypothetical protein [Albimonas pacifica]|uniref:Uncharacterized protein n=1 Tax=Albimonas pacifica TaxID=1114924 RepID=A0A1I3CHD6_9RHOB|nr:hypothetical protein [Albimonas pacifica]SFH73875.1 hypothetical protein SAMN05216258_1021 [Albimonas pacifica]